VSFLKKPAISFTQTSSLGPTRDFFVFAFSLIIGVSSLLAESASKTSKKSSALESDRQAPIKMKEVVVTSEKESENILKLQTVPKSSSVFTKDQLRSLENSHLQEIVNDIPNFSARDAGGRSFNTIFGMRGLVNTAYFSESPIAVYLDEIPMGRTYSYSSQLYQLDSLTVLRGPQPSLFGQNSEAGAILIESLKPSNRPAAYATASYGSYDAQKYSGSVLGPIVKDELFAGFSAFYNSREGYLYNTTTGNRPDSQEGVGGRVHLRWTPCSDTEVSLITMQNHFRDGEQRISSLNGNPFQVSHQVDGVTGVNANTTGLKIKHTGDAFKITSVTSYQWWRLDPYRVNFGFPPGAPVHQFMDINQHTISEELRIASSLDQKDEVFWSGGVFYSHDESDYIFARLLPATGAADKSSNFLNDDIYALFGNVRIPLAEDLRIAGGMRFDYRQREGNSVTTDFAGARYVDAKRRSFFNPAPQVGVEYDVDKTLLAYSNIAKGFKTGGLIPFQGASQLLFYDTEHVWTADVGAKKSFLGNSLFVNPSLFYSNVQDYHFERYISATDYTIFNAPEVEIWGGELEALYYPMNGLEFGFGFGYSNAEFKRYIDPQTGVSRAENEVPYVPLYNMAFHAQYRHTSGFMARGEANVVGESYYDDANTPRFRQADYALLDARIGYETKWGGVYFFGKNLTDKLYYAYKSPGLVAGTIGDPRTIGVECRINY
jgi:iron complex outermembrane recepter protein